MKKRFWENKKSCWVIHKCNPDLIKECPAYEHQDYACWEIEGTVCKLGSENPDRNNDLRCYQCDVYQQYGKGKQIKVMIFSGGVKHAQLQQLLAKREDYKKSRK